jgi:long-subunit acyl-CoA synthetase (AMP-forming)
VGYANPGVEVKLGDGNEILVRSPSNMLGYYKDPTKTAQALDSDGYLHSGDMGLFEADGSLKIIGRVGDIIKTSKGKIVAPLLIESKLLACPYIDQVCLVGNSMPQPMALVALRRGAPGSAQAAGSSRAQMNNCMLQLFEQVNATLDPHEKLKTLVITQGEWTIDNGLLTPTQKIKRKVLETRYQDRIENWYDTRQKVQWE